jgi:alpha-galactosidase
MADLFVTSGLKAAGYEYINLDDCWALPQRDAGGNLVPDLVRFPDGIKAVADYIHSKGLKIGIYTSAGTKTCNSAGFPGALGHEYQDAALFASWGSTTSSTTTATTRASTRGSATRRCATR